jgi:hypothetical protein
MGCYQPVNGWLKPTVANGLWQASNKKPRRDGRGFQYLDAAGA